MRRACGCGLLNGNGRCPGHFRFVDEDADRALNAGYVHEFLINTSTVTSDPSKPGPGGSGRPLNSKIQMQVR